MVIIVLYSLQTKFFGGDIQESPGQSICPSVCLLMSVSATAPERMNWFWLNFTQLQYTTENMNEGG